MGKTAVLRWIVLLEFLYSVGGVSAFSGATWTRVDEDQKPIEGLTIASDLPVVSAPAGSETPIAARLSGTFTSNLNRLLLDGNFIAGGERGGHFSILIPLISERTEIQLTAVSPTGRLIGQTIAIDYPEYSKFRPALSAHKKWRFGLGTGIHRLDYSQTAFSDFTVTSVPVVFHAFYEMSPNQIKWSAHVDGFISAGTLLNTSTSAVRDLRLSAKMAYGFRQEKKPWRIQPQVGAVLRSMIVSPADFGFYRSIGVELSPSLSYATEKAGFFHLMPRYVFVFSGIRDGEWGVRLRWTYAVKPGVVIFLAGEFASFWATTSTVTGAATGTLWSKQWLIWGGFQI